MSAPSGGFYLRAGWLPHAGHAFPGLAVPVHGGLDLLVLVSAAAIVSSHPPER